MTPEIEALTARILQLEVAYDSLLTGARAVEISYDGRTVKYGEPQAADLRTRIAELKRERDRLERDAGMSRGRYGAIRPVIE